MSRPTATTAATVALTATACLFVWNRRRRRRQSIVTDELLKCPYRQELLLAVRLAKQAGDAMERYSETVGTQQHQDLAMEFKGKPQDFCTALDLENEKMICKGILKAFPTHSIIGEESTGTGEIPALDESPTWIIDPIDGTTNFASGLPLSCVSIGYCVDKKPVLGVVYAPMLQEWYVAVQGLGAYRNGVQISNQGKLKTNLENALVVFEFGYTRDKAGIAEMVGGVQRILQHKCRALRGLGSGVLDLCHVARGSIDVVYAGLAGEGWKPWDHCAGMVVATEAGCCIETLNGGEEFDLYSDSIICSVNQDLLNECRQVICKGL